MQTDRAANSPLEFRHHRSLGSRACAREPALGKLGASEVAIPRLPCDSRLGTWPFNFAPESSYAVEVHAAHPTRFGLIKPVDPTDPGVGDKIADWKATPGAVAIRLMLNRGSDDPTDPGISRVLAAAAQRSLPVNLLCWGRLDQVRLLAARNPDTTLVIDHLGLQQPFEPPPPAEP